LHRATLRFAGVWNCLALHSREAQPPSHSYLPQCLCKELLFPAGNNMTLCCVSCASGSTQKSFFSSTTYRAAPWLLAVGLPPLRRGFDAGSVHLSFVVDKVALRQVSPRALRYPPVSFIPPCSVTWRRTQNNHLHLDHRAAQEALGLRCARSVCWRGWGLSSVRKHTL
jgi:hypothetical protein